MGDLDRIEKLAQNLESPIAEIRLRAAKNLLSKTQFGIISANTIANSSSTAVALATGISSCLKTAFNDAVIKHKDLSCDLPERVPAHVFDNKFLAAPRSGGASEDISAATTAIEIIDTLSMLLQRISMSENVPTLAADVFADVLDQLYVISLSDDIPLTTKNHIEEAINSLCSFKTTANVVISGNNSTADASLFQQQQQPSSSHYRLDLKGDFPDKNQIEELEFSRFSTFRQAKATGVAPKGAGAILLSPLVQSGWRFPDFVLTESDERFLFDLEVKVKLGHRSAGPILWDTLEDFPTHALLQRPGLINSMLDVLGSTVIESYTDDIGDDDSSAGPSATTLSPLLAVRWFEGLVKKSADAFQAQLDGGLCSRIPRSLASLPNSSGGGGSSGGGQVSAAATGAAFNGDAAAVTVPTLADQLAKTMYASRHPVLPSPSDSATATATANSQQSNQQKYFSSAVATNSTSTAMLPVSLPGLAFAVCTASLPLLQSRDVALAAAVLSLTDTALPYIFEPTAARASGAAVSGPSRSQSALLGDVDKSRLQHLLNRVEQLLNFFGESIPASIETLQSSFKNYEGLAAAATSVTVVGGHGEQNDDETTRLLVDDVDAVTDLRSVSLDAVILKVFVSYMSVVPPSLVHDASVSNSSFGDKSISLGQRTLHLLQRMCSAWQSAPQSLIVQTHTQQYGQTHNLADSDDSLSPLRFLLSSADSAASRSLFAASEIVDSALAVRDLTLGRRLDGFDSESGLKVGHLNHHRGGVDTLRCALDNAHTATRLADKQHVEKAFVNDGFSLRSDEELDLGIGYSVAVLAVASVVVHITEKSRDTAEIKAEAIGLFCSLFSSGDERSRQRMLVCLLELAAVARPNNQRVKVGLSAASDPLANAIMRANFGFVRIGDSTGVSNLWIDGDNKSYVKSVAPVDILAGIVDSLAEPGPLRLLLGFGVLGSGSSSIPSNNGGSEEEKRGAGAGAGAGAVGGGELTKLLTIALLDIICDRKNSLAVVAAGRAAVQGARSKLQQTDPPKATESGYAPLLMLLKTLEWTHTRDDALPRSISSFIQRIEDYCATATTTASATPSSALPGDVRTADVRTADVRTAEDAYGRSLSLGLFHGSQAVRARCALRLRHELAGLSAPSEAIFEDTAAAEVANTYDPFPPHALVHLYGYADRGISRGIVPGSDELEVDDSVFSAGFTHSDVRKLVEIAFGGRDLPKSQIVRDEGLRASALKQLRGILKGDSGLLTTADASWCIDLCRKCCEAVAAAQQESLISGGSKTASEILYSVTGSVAVEAAATLKMLASRLPSVRAAASFRPSDLSSSSSSSLSSSSSATAVPLSATNGCGSGSVVDNFSCRPLLAILLQQSRKEGDTDINVPLNPRLEALRLLAAQTLLIILLDVTPLLLSSGTDNDTDTGTGSSPPPVPVPVLPKIRAEVLEPHAAAAADRLQSNPGMARLPLFMLNHFGLAKLSDHYDNDNSHSYLPSSQALAAEVSAVLGVNLIVRTSSSSSPSSSSLLQMHAERDFVAVSLSGASGPPISPAPAAAASRGAMSSTGARIKSRSSSHMPPFRFLVQVYRGAVAPSRRRVISSLARWAVTQTSRAIEHATRRDKGSGGGGHTHAHLRDVLSSIRSLGVAYKGFLEELVDLGISGIVKPFLQMQHNSIDELLSLEVTLKLLTETVESSLTHYGHATQMQQQQQQQLSTPVQVQLAECIDNLSSYLIRYVKSPAEDFISSSSRSSSNKSNLFTEQGRILEVHMQQAVLSVQEACLSLWRTCVSTNGPLPHTPLLANSASLLTHPLPTILANLLSSELWPAATRSHAAAVLDRLVRWHGAVDSLVVTSKTHKQTQTQTQTQTQASSSRTKSSALFYSHYDDTTGDDFGLIRSSALDVIKCAAKLLRPPDSMRFGAGLLGCLRVLLLVLLASTSGSGSGSGSDVSLLLDLQDLRWLVRLSYDRRASVRTLALELLGVFAQVNPSVFDNTSYEDNNEDGADNSSLDGPSDVSSHLRHIFMDTTECPLARTTALRAAVTIECHRTQLSRGVRHRLQGPALGQILTGIADCLDIDGKFATPSAVQSSLAVLTDLMVALLSSADPSADSSTELLDLIRSLKLVKSVVEVLRGDLLVCMRLHCLERVGVSATPPGSIDIWGASAVRDADSGLPAVALTRGWGANWDRATVRTDALAYFDLQEAACRILQLIQDIDEELMEQCARHTQLLPYLVSALGGAPRLDECGGGRNSSSNMTAQTSPLPPSLVVLLTAHENNQHHHADGTIPSSLSELKPYELGMLHKVGLSASKVAISKRWLFSRSHQSFSAVADLLSAYITQSEMKAAAALKSTTSSSSPSSSSSSSQKPSSAIEEYLHSNRNSGAALAPLHILTALAYRINGVGNIIEHLSSFGREDEDDGNDDDDRDAGQLTRGMTDKDVAMLLSSTVLSGTGPATTITPALRLINLLISNATWRSGLGLGGPFEGPSIGPEAKFVLSSLVHLKSSVDSAAAWLQSVSISNNSEQPFLPTEAPVKVKVGCVSVSMLSRAVASLRATSSQTSVTLSLLLQHSYGARQLISRGLETIDHNDVDDDNDGDGDDNGNDKVGTRIGTRIPEEGLLREEGPLLLMAVIRAVKESVLLLRTPSDNIGSTSKDKIKKDLAVLKSKSRATDVSNAEPSIGVSVQQPQSCQPQVEDDSTKNGNSKNASKSPVKKQSFSSSFASPTSRPVKLLQQQQQQQQQQQPRAGSRGYTWKQQQQQYVGNCNSRTAIKSRTAVAAGQASATVTAAVTASPNASAIDLPEEYRMQVWSSMLLLQTAFVDNEKVQNLAADFGLQDTLNHLIRLVGYWASITTITTSQQQQHRHTADSSSWIPSEGHLATAVLALCSAFVHDNVGTKQKLIAAGETLASLQCSSSPGTAAGSTMHQLLSLGLSRSVAPSFRWLCFELTESLASVDNKLTLSQAANSTNKLAAQKVALAHVLNIAIQRTLHSSAGPRQSTDPQAVVQMLDAYTACLCSSASATQTTVKTMKYGTGGSGLSSAGSIMGYSMGGGSAKGYSVGGGSPSALLSLLNGGDNGNNVVASGAGSSSPEFNTIPVPELLAWVWDYHLKLGGSSNTAATTTAVATTDKEGNLNVNRLAIAAAVLRCLGRMAAPLSIADYENDNIENEGSALQVANVTTSSSISRRLIVNSMSEQALRIYIQALETYGDERKAAAAAARDTSTGTSTLSAITAAALCTLLFHSEQARALVRGRLDDRHRKLLFAPSLSFRSPAGGCSNSYSSSSNLFSEVAKVASEGLVELLM